MASKIKIGNKLIYKNLDTMLAGCEPLPLTSDSKWVIFSDVHMGDGGSTDDFKPNSPMFMDALEDYYLKNQYGLILNGDIEELLRFPLAKIQQKWGAVYELLNEFSSRKQLIKIAGNHDLELLVNKQLQPEYNIQEAVRFKFGEEVVNIFHGHQASKSFQEQSQLVGFTLKYFANPLRIKNYSVAHNSLKQYKIEKRVYGYSAFNKTVSVIGHTHRPLFESMHKVERLKFKIEQLCREFATREPSEDIRESIKALKSELKKYARKGLNPFTNYVYNSVFHIPCLFNSGCVIGKRGMTGLEISGDKIRLIHWFDKNTSKKYLQHSGYQPEQLGDTDYYRMVINEESLHYIFTRIKFLA